MCRETGASLKPLESLYQRRAVRCVYTYVYTCLCNVDGYGGGFKVSALKDLGVETEGEASETAVKEGKKR